MLVPFPGRYGLAGFDRRQRPAVFEFLPRNAEVAFSAGENRVKTESFESHSGRSASTFRREVNAEHD